jgi:hypothetical protein
LEYCDSWVCFLQAAKEIFGRAKSTDKDDSLIIISLFFALIEVAKINLGNITVFLNGPPLLENEFFNILDNWLENASDIFARKELAHLGDSDSKKYWTARVLRPCSIGKSRPQ